MAVSKYSVDIAAQNFLVRDIQRIILWLDHWPAGLKLNTELSALYCRSLLGAMMGWNREYLHETLPRASMKIWLCRNSLVPHLASPARSCVYFWRLRVLRDDTDCRFFERCPSSAVRTCPLVLPHVALGLQATDECC